MKVTAIKNMLMAQDPSRAIDFYRGVFGFGVKFESDHWSELTAGDCIIALHGEHDGSPNRVSLSIEADDVNAAMRAVKEHGGREAVPPVQREGEPIIYSEFVDTEGNIVMMTQYVGEP